SDSNTIIDRICHYSKSIVDIDNDIEMLSCQVSSNLQNLSHLTHLYDKSVLLESSLYLNDDLANAFSMECLQNEYSHVKLAFQSVNSNGFSIDKKSKVNINSNDEINNIPDQPSPTLATVLSLSNLKLKPIRCKSKKIYKKKSRYRLSS